MRAPALAGALHLYSAPDRMFRMAVEKSKKKQFTSLARESAAG
jgi:hypothetical protein